MFPPHFHPRNMRDTQMSGLNQFHNVTTQDIEKLLVPLGFIRVNLHNTAEITFSKIIQFEGAPTVVRIYTGILKATGESRPAGQDAIRVCLGRAHTTDNGGTGDVRIFKTLQTVRRIGTWAVHLLERINSIGNGLAEVPTQELTEADLLAGRTKVIAPPSGQLIACPVCGAKMVGPKPSRKGAFYGCSHFPSCRGSRNLSEVMLADGSVAPSTLWVPTAAVVR